MILKTIQLSRYMKHIIRYLSSFHGSNAFCHKPWKALKLILNTSTQVFNFLFGIRYFPQSEKVFIPWNKINNLYDIVDWYQLNDCKNKLYQKSWMMNNVCMRGSHKIDHAMICQKIWLLLLNWKDNDSKERDRKVQNFHRNKIHVY